MFVMPKYFSVEQGEHEGRNGEFYKCFKNEYYYAPLEDLYSMGAQKCAVTETGPTYIVLFVPFDAKFVYC